MITIKNRPREMQRVLMELAHTGQTLSYNRQQDYSHRGSLALVDWGSGTPAEFVFRCQECQLEDIFAADSVDMLVESAGRISLYRKPVERVCVYRQERSALSSSWNFTPLFRYGDQKRYQR